MRKQMRFSLLGGVSQPRAKTALGERPLCLGYVYFAPNYLRQPRPAGMSSTYFTRMGLQFLYVWFMVRHDGREWSFNPEALVKLRNS